MILILDYKNHLFNSVILSMPVVIEILTLLFLGNNNIDEDKQHRAIMQNVSPYIA